MAGKSLSSCIRGESWCGRIDQSESNACARGINISSHGRPTLLRRIIDSDLLLIVRRRAEGKVCVCVCVCVAEWASVFDPVSEKVRLEDIFGKDAVCFTVSDLSECLTANANLNEAVFQVSRHFRYARPLLLLLLLLLRLLLCQLLPIDSSTKLITYSYAIIVYIVDASTCRFLCGSVPYWREIRVSQRVVTRIHGIEFPLIENPCWGQL